MAQPDLATYTGRRNTITVGDHLRDKRDHNTRTLRIDRIYETEYDAVRAACTVVAVDGEAIAKTRTTDLAAAMLAGPNFLPTSTPQPAEEDPDDWVAGRDARGDIRLSRGQGLLVARGTDTRADIQGWLDRCDNSRYRRQYLAALALLDTEEENR